MTAKPVDRTVDEVVDACGRRPLLALVRRLRSVVGRERRRHATEDALVSGVLAKHGELTAYQVGVRAELPPGGGYLVLGRLHAAGRVESRWDGAGGGRRIVYRLADGDPKRGDCRRGLTEDAAMEPYRRDDYSWGPVTHGPWPDVKELD